jgi:hypothetical protein
VRLAKLWSHAVPAGRRGSYGAKSANVAGRAIAALAADDNVMDKSIVAMTDARWVRSSDFFVVDELLRG